MPVFFDAGLIILIPLAFSLAKRTKRSVLYLSLIHIYFTSPHSARSVRGLFMPEAV